ncbi:MAG: ParB/RepB/Spo0J family partition protein [Clostridiales bacterium]|nr:ParB/RepB/Spo0J family partition protein [Clostridiales bacterium]
MRAAEKIRLNSFDSLFGSTNTETKTEIRLNELFTFKNHPFKVIDDEKMDELVESIKENGVLNPAIVRPLECGGYELISGHRRKHACELAGLETIPAFVKDLSDEEATIIMVDSNIQREELLPSEKAYSYKMRLEAMKRKAGRRSKNDAQIEQAKPSVEFLAKEVGESRATIQRFIRLTLLSENLLSLVDSKKIPVSVGTELSYIPIEGQNIIENIISSFGAYPSIKQAKRLREYSENGKLTKESAEAILTESADKAVSLSFGSEIKKYFPENYGKKEMQEYIIKLLEKNKLLS